MTINPELFKRKTNSSDVLNKEWRESNHKEINSWDDFFEGVFGEPVKRPHKFRIYVKRHLPVNHSENKTGIEIHFPFQFGFTDANNERWFGVLFDLGKEQTDWQFLVFKPDRETYLMYLAGMVELMQLYYTTDKFYLCRPDVTGDTMFLLTPKELKPEMLPLPGTKYSNNIVFNPKDVFWGMNTAPSTEVIRFAEQKQFY